jgi:hypothetical protein
MLHFKTLNVTPPGGWRFTDPNSGLVSEANIFPDLLQKVHQHRRNNNFLPLTESEIEDIVCRSLTPAAQAEFCTDGARIPDAVPWTKVAEFIKTAAAWVAHRDAYVPQEEAERRAAICAGCPYNRGIAGNCAACHATVNALRTAVLKKATRYDDKLKACALCGCDNKLTVHVPLKALETVSHDFSLAQPWCWRDPTSPNYKKKVTNPINKEYMMPSLASAPQKESSSPQG